MIKVDSQRHRIRKPSLLVKHLLKMLMHINIIVLIFGLFFLAYWLWHVYELISGIGCLCPGGEYSKLLMIWYQ